MAVLQIEHSPCQNLSWLLCREIGKPILKSLWKFRGPRVARTSWKRTKMAHLHFSFSKLPAELQCYYIGMWLDTYPWNRIQNLEINPHIYNQLIFNKHTKKNWVSTCKRRKLDPTSHCVWEINQNAPKTWSIKFLENISTYFHDFRLGSGFLGH